MTQRLLADRVGRSKSWIEKIEAGTRNADRLPILLTICKELRVDLAVLIGRDPGRGTSECIDDIQVEAIRAALERYESISDNDPKTSLPDIARLRRQLTFVWAAFEQADYHVVSQHLPALLRDAQRSSVIHNSDETTVILCEIYQITASTLRKLGEYELAWLAGDRGLALSDRLADPLLTALVGFRIAEP